MSFKFILSGVVIPKARPRFNGKIAYTSDRYAAWKDWAIAQFSSQAMNLGLQAPIDRAAVSIQVQGAMRGDLDNIAGSVLDALVQGGILVNDSASRVPELHITYHPKCKQKGLVVTVEAIAAAKKRGVA